MSKQYHLHCFNIIQKVRGRKERGQKGKRRKIKRVEKGMCERGRQEGETHTCMGTRVTNSVDPQLSQVTTGYEISQTNT